jgi:hypothetical protein
MKDNTLNTIRHIGVATKFFGLGIIAGLYLSDSQFRYPYILVVILIFAGECTRIWANHRKGQKPGRSGKM